MDVREKLVKQAISHFWYGVSHDIFSEPVTTYAKLAIEALEKEKENGVTVQECALGDKIYQTDGVRIYESTIGEITLTNKHTIFVTENIAFDERAIGKSIFLSYEEAEKHLPQPPKGE